ncbi:hypothetical protein LG71_25860 [Pluralibacter gergoviae]|nr:hypothetical protein LG71_25860 [Pluralibacter gergoviae]
MKAAGIARNGRSPRRSAFELPQTFGQQPQRAIEADVLIDALHSARALMTASGSPAGQTSFDEVFLYPVEHRPQIRAIVIEPVCRQNLAFSYRQHLAFAVIFERQGRPCEDFRLAIIERDRSHGFAGVLHLVESAQDLVGAFDYMVCDIALVGHTNVTDDIAAHQTVLAHETEHASQHLVAAGAIMRIEQNYLIRLFAVDLACMAKAEHVFRELATVFMTHAGLAHHEGLEPFIA